MNQEHSLFCELISENIPSRMQNIATKYLKDQLYKNFIHCEIKESEIFCTTYRMVFYLRFVIKEEKKIKGPRYNASEQAIAGFLKKYQYTKDDLFILQEKGIDFYYVKQNIKQAYKQFIIKLLNDLPWPIKMRWNNLNYYWVRPLKNFLYMLDDEILEIDFHGCVSTNNTLDNHAQKLVVTSYADYLQKINSMNIFLDKNLHKHDILQQLKILNVDYQQISEDFLNEITGLAEKTYCLVVEFDVEGYQRLSAPIIQALFQQQKCWLFYSIKKFIIFSNIQVIDNGENIIRGYKMMLKSKLDDLLFFQQQDLQTDISTMINNAHQSVYHQKLGNMKQRILRITHIVYEIYQKNLQNSESDLLLQKIANDLSRIELENVHEHEFFNVFYKILTLCKMDLVSSLANEIPEMHGAVGSTILQYHDFANEILSILQNHYSLNENDINDLFLMKLIALINLADSLEKIYALCFIGEISTSSQDPYAIKKTCINIIKYSIILDIDLKYYLDWQQLMNQQHIVQNIDLNQLQQHLYSLLLERFIFNYFANQHKNLILAICNSQLHFNFNILRQKIHSLIKIKDIIYKLSVLYQRIKNSIKVNITFDFFQHSHKVFDIHIKQLLSLINNSAFKTQAEHNLFQMIQELCVMDEIKKVDYLNRNTSLINDFFDNCLINSADEIEKTNRVKMLNILILHMHSVLDFNLLTS